MGVQSITSNMSEIKQRIAVLTEQAVSGHIPVMTFHVRRSMPKDSPWVTAEPVWVTISKPFEAATIGQILIPDDGREHFGVLLLNSQNHVLGWHVVGIGGVASVMSSPREIFGAALRTPGCSTILCVHNHPSGDVTPSKHDEQITRQLMKGAKILDIRLHDHVIIGNGTRLFHSFASKGIIKP